jgi:hypothetical protein
MAWQNPGKPKLEIKIVNNKSRQEALGNIVPVYGGFETAPTDQTPLASSNTAPNTRQESGELGDKRSAVNRALNQRRDDDTVKNQSIGLMDIDEAIVSYMDSGLGIQVQDNGQQIPVPVIYGSPERWQAAQKNGYLRDKKGSVQLPIVMIKRTAIARNDQLMTFNRHISETFVRKYSPKNRYDKFSVLNGKNSPMKPVHEVYNVTLPDQVILSYSCMIWTDYIEQMNTIIETINFAAEEYWGDPERFKFRVRIPEYSNTVDVEADGYRLVRTEFTMEVWAYLLPPKFENNVATVQKSLTPRKIVVGLETCMNATELYNLPAREPAKFRVAEDDTIAIRQSLYNYLSVQSTVYGQFVSDVSGSTTVRFPSKSLSDTPSTLKNTIADADKFRLYIDGKVVSKQSVTNFHQDGSDFVVELSDITLPLIINTSTEIYSSGKFK